MKTKNSLMYSVTCENYQKNILNDKENKTQGSWLISQDMTQELKYAYVYLKNSEKMTVKKYPISVILTVCLLSNFIYKII